jgi:hypothetical protein
MSALRISPESPGEFVTKESKLLMAFITDGADSIGSNRLGTISKQRFRAGLQSTVICCRWSPSCRVLPALN